MKLTKYFAMAFACLALTACQKDWDDPQTTPYGNSGINDDNIITIAQLKADYPNVFAESDKNAKIERDIKIKGRVTGNDIGSNLYKQFALQDETGAIIVAVNQSGMHGYLAEGQEIVIDLKDLYIGGYRKQPELGAPYNGNSIGRMSKDVWNDHFKILGNINSVNPNVVAPVEFNSAFQSDMNGNCARLVTIKNVTFADADGQAVFAPQGENNTNRQMIQNGKNLGSNIVVRTSSYADFAAMKLPYDTVTRQPLPCNITGIATRYNATWQILIRNTSDIEIIK